MSIRTFVALELSRPVKESILGLIESLKERDVRASWARSSTLHLTIKFLGDVAEEQIQEVSRAVSRAVCDTAVFEFVVSGIGAFPSSRRPRMLWIGVEPSTELSTLAQAVDRELSRLGFQRERRRFRPHITLGRIRDPGSQKDLGSTLGELATPQGRVVVREVRIMKSTLAPGGAIHEVLCRVPLPGEGG